MIDILKKLAELRHHDMGTPTEIIPLKHCYTHHDLQYDNIKSVHQFSYHIPGDKSGKSVMIEEMEVIK